MENESSNIPQNKYPVRVQVVDGSGDQVTSFGGGGGGGASTIADGADIAEGAIADSAVAAGAAGSVSAKLRRVTTDLDAVKTSAASIATNTGTTATNIGTTGASAKQMQGNVAHDTADSGNSVKIGGKASATAPSDVSADADRVDAWYLRNGAQASYSAYASDEDIDSITSYDKGYTYTRLTADGVVSASPVGLCGYYVEASSSGVISLYDNASAGSGNTMLALSKAVTTNDLVILPKPILMTNGVFFDLVSGSATVSILTRKTVTQ